MPPHVFVAVLKSVVAGVALLIGSLWYFLFSKDEEDRTPTADHHTYGTTRSRYTGTTNNHDHQKFAHQTMESATAEVRRMQREGYADSDRLNAYQGVGGKFYVGKGWKEY